MYHANVQLPTGVDDVTSQLSGMNVDRSMNETCQESQNFTPDCAIQTNDLLSTTNRHQSLQSIDFPSYHMPCNLENCHLTTDSMYENEENVGQTNKDEQQSSRILVVTNLDPAIFSDFNTQAIFEDLFRQFDFNVEFRYLRSFRRVRLDFIDEHRARAALENLRDYKLGNSIFKTYMVQFIKSQNASGNLLMLPKLTKQFLISPPASPPEGWEPISEGPPVIDVQLISAIANLVPGQVHEIHPASETHPGIFVEVCEDIVRCNERVVNSPSIEIDDFNMESLRSSMEMSTKLGSVNLSSTEATQLPRTINQFKTPRPT